MGQPSFRMLVLHSRGLRLLHPLAVVFVASPALLPLLQHDVELLERSYSNFVDTLLLLVRHDLVVVQAAGCNTAAAAAAEAALLVAPLESSSDSSTPFFAAAAAASAVLVARGTAEAVPRMPFVAELTERLVVGPLSSSDALLVHFHASIVLPYVLKTRTKGGLE